MQRLFRIYYWFFSCCLICGTLFWPFFKIYILRGRLYEVGVIVVRSSHFQSFQLVYHARTTFIEIYMVYLVRARYSYPLCRSGLAEIVLSPQLGLRTKIEQHLWFCPTVHHPLVKMPSCRCLNIRNFHQNSNLYLQIMNQLLYPLSEPTTANLKKILLRKYYV